MAEAWGDLLLGAYSLGGRLAVPALPLIMKLRARQDADFGPRTNERRADTPVARPAGTVVWVHAASVGETNAVLPLIRRLREQGVGIVLTTVTPTGAETAARGLPSGAVHQFVPLDIRPLVRRFLAHWRPDLALFVESEIWPVMTDELDRHGVPQIIVNGRISERALRRWQRLMGASRRVFSRISLALAQTPLDAARLRRLGASHIEIAGNLKFDSPAPTVDATALAAFEERLAGRPVWLAASTHPGEEEIVAAAHRVLAAAHPDLVTVIVPRHPDRGPDIASALSSEAEVWLRSRGTPWRDGAGILIADTLGELGLFYRVAPVAFIGGSLVARGGQNPIEAVKLGCAVLHGPTTHNFAAVYSALDAAGGAITVTDAETLAAAVGRLLVNASDRERQVANAEVALRPLAGALDRTMAALSPFLNRVGRAA